MRINADFTQRAVSLAEDAQWQPSPQAGVTRRMLDRVGDEIARATSVVRYAPGSHFKEHTHGGGEELLVLDGVFGDEHGEYPAGSYLRNPIGTRHAPYSEPGCTLLVKLWQFDPDDTAQFVIDTQSRVFKWTRYSGVTVLSLHRFGDEHIELQRWASGAQLPTRSYPGGAEFFVLEGAFADADGLYPAGSWLRLPPGYEHSPHSEQGCLLYLKIGHLPPRRLPE